MEYDMQIYISIY